MTRTPQGLGEDYFNEFIFNDTNPDNKVLWMAFIENTQVTFPKKMLKKNPKTNRSSVVLSASTSLSAQEDQTTLSQSMLLHLEVTTQT